MRRIKLYLLKNKEELVVRKAQKDDAQRIIEFVQKVAVESDNLTFGEGEFNITIEQEESILEEALTSDNKLFIVAEINGRIVGNLTFLAGKRPRVQHSGEFGISVLKEYWNQGVGQSLLDYLITWAKETKIIRKINLKVRTDNYAGIKLYEKFGFKHEGTITRNFYINGEFYDSYEMGLEID